MSYKIGSFNLFKFSYQNDDNMKKNINKIAEIIREEGMDIVAIQEIFNKGSMDRLTRELGGDKMWEGRWISPPSRSSIAAEGYAFIWNKRRISLVKNKFGEIFEPRIINQYKKDPSSGRKGLIRNPFYARFTPLGTNGGSFFEIRLINTHIVFSDNDYSDIDVRKQEFEMLATTIYPKISDKVFDQFLNQRNGYNMPVYTVLLGDYNLNLNRAWTVGPYLNEEIIIDNGKKRIVTVQDQLTTLKMKTPEQANENVRGYANNYDHCTFDANRFDSVSVKCRRVDAVRSYYGDDFELYRKEISDHIPIIFELDLIK